MKRRNFLKGIMGVIAGVGAAPILAKVIKSDDILQVSPIDPPFEIPHDRGDELTPINSNDVSNSITGRHFDGNIRVYESEFGDIQVYEPDFNHHGLQAWVDSPQAGTFDINSEKIIQKMFDDAFKG